MLSLYTNDMRIGVRFIPGLLVDDYARAALTQKQRGYTDPH